MNSIWVETTSNNSNKKKYKELKNKEKMGKIITEPTKKKLDIVDV